MRHALMLFGNCLLLAACATEPAQAPGSMALENLYFPKPQIAETPTVPTTEERLQQGAPSFGNLTFADGSQYQGQLVNGNCEGQGVLSQASGHVFTGIFVQNKAVEGSYRLANGETHIGQFIDFKLHGDGVKILADGTHVRAHFEHGKIMGEAVITPKDISKQDAFQIWKQHELVFAVPGPKAIVKLQNQDRGCKMLDAGNHKQYWLHALGKCHRGLANGLSYLVSKNSHELIEGNFKNGYLQTGIKFTYYPYHGGFIEKTLGNFNHFTINGPGQRYHDKQLIYVGEFVADEFHGMGSAYNKKGEIVYQGSFAYGKRHGQGTCLFRGEQEHCVYHNGERVDETHIMRNTQRQRPGLPVAGSVLEKVVKPIMPPQKLHQLPKFNVSIPWAGISDIPYHHDTVGVIEKTGSRIARMEKGGKQCSGAVFLTPDDPQSGLVMVELVHRIRARHDKAVCIGGYLDKQLHSYMYRCENGKWQYLKRIVEKDNADMLDCYLNGYVTHYLTKPQPVRPKIDGPQTDTAGAQKLSEKDK